MSKSRKGSNNKADESKVASISNPKYIKNTENLVDEHFIERYHEVLHKSKIKKEAQVQEEEVTADDVQIPIEEFIQEDAISIEFEGYHAIDASLFEIASPPIDYFKLRSRYYKELGFDVRESTIQPNKDGFVSDGILELVDHSIPETTVVNVGVGQGKTYCAYQLIEYYCKNNYIVIMVAPFIRLVNRDEQQLIERLGDEYTISNYKQINKDLDEDTLEALAKSNVHLLTINALLGNPGEMGLVQNKSKRTYQQAIIAHAKQLRKKVVIVFDEIHEAVYNFHDQYLYYLHNWQGVVHRSYILSATYTLAAKICIEYIANLTQKRIHLIDCERDRAKVQERKVSNLHVLFMHEKYSLNESFKPIIDKAIEWYQLGLFINIICPFRSWAEDLRDMIKAQNQIDPPINPVLHTSSTDVKFDERNFNIGTTFKTGISIESSNQIFIVIAPPYAEDTFPRNSIFSEGNSAIIQALARPRNGGAVVVCLPFPRKLINGVYLDSLKRLVPEFDEFESIERKQFQQSETDLAGYYRTTRKPIERHLRKAENESLEEGDKVQFPRFKRFVIEQGQEHLARLDENFGKNFGPLFLWLAMNNQFLTTRLKAIHRPNLLAKTIEFFTSNMYKAIQRHLNDMDECNLLELNPLNGIYQLLEQKLNDPVMKGIKVRSVYKLGSRVSSVSKLLGNTNFFRAFMTVAYNEYGFSYIGEVTNLDKEDYSGKRKYSRRDYLLAHAAIALELQNEVEIDETSKVSLLRNGYLCLGRAISLFLNELEDIKELSITRDEGGLISEDIHINFEEFEKVVLVNDPFYIKHFRREGEKKKLDPYKFLLDLLVRNGLESTRPSKGLGESVNKSRPRLYSIEEVYQIPRVDQVVNVALVTELLSQ